MYTNYVDYLNLEYVLLRAYNFVAEFHFVLGDIPGWVITTVTTVVVVGMIASLVLLLLAVYAQIRLLQVEHAGFHALEATVHKQHEPDVESAGTNERWEHIVGLVNSSNHGDWRRAILEADIMLGDALSSAGYEGSSVGEQLKIANPTQLTNLRRAWDAHMLRNKIAHGGESFELSERDTRTAIDNYKRVFEELGFI